MPLSAFSLIPYIANELIHTRPKKVLDLGIGFGLYGAIVRQYLDNGVYKKKYKFEERDYYEWETSLVGVEGFREYKNPAWDLYNVVQTYDMRDYIEGTLEKTDWRPDFIILSDVIEHFEKEEGYAVIDRLIELLAPGGTLLISTPAFWIEQGDVNGNEYERHKSLWMWNEFPHGFTVIRNGAPDQFGHKMNLVKYVKK